MACNCGKQNSQTTIPAQVASSATDGDYVMVKYLSNTQGDHHVVGTQTKRSYGYRYGGEQFIIHRSDLAAQPHLFSQITETTRPQVQEQIISPIASPVPIRVKIEQAQEKIVAPQQAPKQAPKLELQAPTKLSIISQPRTVDRLDVSPATREQLIQAGFISTSDFLSRQMDLTSIKGIGKTKAKNIIEQIRGM